MHCGGMPVLFQPGSERENADRHHAIRQHREIGLAGNEIESCRVNQGYAHRLFREVISRLIMRTTGTFIFCAEDELVRYHVCLLPAAQGCILLQTIRL